MASAAPTTELDSTSFSIDEDVINDLKLAFDSFDVSHDGSLDILELARAFELLGMSIPLPTLRTFYKKYADKSTGITFENFKTLLKENFVPGNFGEKVLKHIFMSMDKNGDKLICASELKSGMKSLGITVTKTTVQQLMKTVDKNNDGLLDLEEFSKLFTEKLEAGPDNKELAYNWNRLIHVTKWLQIQREPKITEGFYESWRDKPANTKIITFVRHGQSQANADSDRYHIDKFRYEPGLTNKGVAQCVNSRRNVEIIHEKVEMELLVVSPLNRTIQTSQHICGKWYLTALEQNDQNREKKQLKIIGNHLCAEQITASDDIGSGLEYLKEFHTLVDWSEIPEHDGWFYIPDHILQKAGKKKEELTTEEIRKLFTASSWSEPWYLTVQRAEKFEAWLKERQEKRICVVAHSDFLLALTGYEFGNAQVLCQEWEF